MKLCLQNRKKLSLSVIKHLNHLGSKQVLSFKAKRDINIGDQVKNGNIMQ